MGAERRRSSTLVKTPNPAQELVRYTIENSATMIYLKTEKPQIPRAVRDRDYHLLGCQTLPGILYVPVNPENGWGK